MSVHFINSLGAQEDNNSWSVEIWKASLDNQAKRLVKMGMNMGVITGFCINILDSNCYNHMFLQTLELR